MRVIAGSAKGTRLKSPSSRGTRPITDRAKEALFSILTPRLNEASFLDLFAGTGGVGIEALSRGATAATFVELDSAAIGDLRTNLTKTKLQSRATVVQADVFRYLQGSASCFDIVWVAPPQWKDLWARAVLLLDTQPGWLNETGILVVHCDPKEVRPLALETLERIDVRKYSNVALSFFRSRS